MIQSKRKYDNVYWFLIDGLRPDFLHIKEDYCAEKNYFDELLEKGTVFNNVVTSGAGTYTSMHSIFTSLLPSYNGETGWTRTALRKFNQNIFTIADYFQLAGYETYAYADTDEGRPVPMSGFKIWESCGYRNILKTTDMGRTDRYRKFIEELNKNKKNKFVYYHTDLLHDLNCGLGEVWDSKDYSKNINILAEEFKRIYEAYQISERDLVIISADHGVMLDKDYMHDGLVNGDRQYEETVISFFAMIGKGIKEQVLSKPVSALDEAPTLLHVALNQSMSGQGIDRFDYMQNGIYKESIFFREKNTFCAEAEKQSPLKSDIFYIRDGKWKYVYGENDPRCEWLIDLERDGDYQINRKNEFPELVIKYRKILEEKLEGSKNFQYVSDLGFDKKAIKKKFSLVIEMKQLCKETIESLLDLGGAYYEIVLYGDGDKFSEYKKNYKVRIVEKSDQKNIKEICCGEWIVLIRENGGWSEYFLSDLYRLIQYYDDENIRIIHKNYVAVRREELNDADYREVAVKNEVRSIRYVCKDNVGKKYILFGCGEIGKKALDYLGDTNVYCFADNNSIMTGKQKYGKRIIDFDELKRVCKDYIIVISTSVNTNSAYEIKKQLEENGILDYVMFDMNS